MRVPYLIRIDLFFQVFFLIQQFFFSPLLRPYFFVIFQGSLFLQFFVFFPVFFPFSGILPPFPFHYLPYLLYPSIIRLNPFSIHLLNFVPLFIKFVVSLAISYLLSFFPRYVLLSHPHIRFSILHALLSLSEYVIF
jgi:hypothetical protein